MTLHAISAIPAEAVLSDQTLGADTASIDFTSITQAYTHLALVAMLRTTQAVVAGSVQLRLNNDSAANYDRQNMRGSGVTSTVIAAAGDTAWAGLTVPGASATAGRFAYLVFEVPFYTSAFTKTLVGRGGYVPNATTTDYSVHLDSGLWRSTAAVTQLTILPAANNLTSGCRAILYGIA